MSWFAIALDEIRTRWILRETTDCKQSKKKETSFAESQIKHSDLMWHYSFEMRVFGEDVLPSWK